MRIVPLAELASLVQQATAASPQPRIVTSGNFASPIETLQALVGQLE